MNALRKRLRERVDLLVIDALIIFVVLVEASIEAGDVAARRWSELQRAKARDLLPGRLRRLAEEELRLLREAGRLNWQ